MIRLNELIPAASVNKTHGIHGELSVTADPDVELAVGSCLVMPVDGIPVPFFIKSLRERSADTYLIGIDGVDTDSAAADFVGATLYVDPSSLADNEDDENEDGFYASMLTGYTLFDTQVGEIGKIIDLDMSTANILLIVRRDDGREIMVPLASDLITDINQDLGEITMDLPSGLLEM